MSLEIKSQLLMVVTNYVTYVLSIFLPNESVLWVQTHSLNTQLNSFSLKVRTLPCQNLKYSHPSLRPNLVILVRVPLLNLWSQQWCHLHWWWLAYNTYQRQTAGKYWAVTSHRGLLAFTCYTVFIWNFSYYPNACRGC